MARSGLYKSDVKKARDALIVQGRNPSVDAVRVELGNTGSKTTIHKYLKELEEEDGGASGKRASISDSLQDLVERLAAKLHEEAATQIETARQEFDEKAHTHETALLAAQQENSKMLAHMRELEAAFEQQDGALVTVREALQRESTARHVAEQLATDLKERLTENDAHRQSIEEKHQHARDALEHYRQSVKEQREADARRHEQQAQQLQAELRLAQQTISVKQEETTRLNQEGVRLVAELSHTRQGLHETQEAAQRFACQIELLRATAQQHDILKSQLFDKDARLQELQEQLAVESTRSEDQAKQLHKLELALAQSEARCEMQQGMVAELRAFLAARDEQRLPNQA